MSKFDDTLRDSLSADDEAFLKSLDDEPGLFVQLGAAFAGSMKAWTVFAVVFSLGFFVFSLFALWQAHIAADTQRAILWTTLALGAWISVGLIKIWFWLRMNHLNILREIKRLELQVARLNGN